MRNVWNWCALVVASWLLLAAAPTLLAAPTFGEITIRPHRNLGHGATADGTVNTWFVVEAVVTPGQGESVTLVRLRANGSPLTGMVAVGPNRYRAAFPGSTLGPGSYTLTVSADWSNNQGPQGEAIGTTSASLIIAPAVRNVFTRAQLWRQRTLFEDEVLSSVDPLQSDPLRPDPLDLLAPDEGSSSTRYRFRVVYRHPYGIPPQPIYSSFNINGAGAYSYLFLRDTFMPPSVPAPHAEPLWGTGRRENNDFGGVYIRIEDNLHWMVPIYKLDSAGNAIPLGTLTPQDFQNGVVYEYIWEPTHHITAQGDTRYGLQYKYGRPTDNAFVVATPGRYNYAFVAGLDHFPTSDSEPAVFEPGNPLNDASYPHYSGVNPVINPMLSGFRTAFSPNFLYLGTVTSDDMTVFQNPDAQLPNGPYHPQPGPTAPGTRSLPVVMGSEDTVYEFRIYYRGERDPAYIRVYISNDFTGSSYPIQLLMQPLTPGQTNPGVYVARTRLSRGPHTYYFEANDGVRTVRFPVRSVDDPVLPANAQHPRGRNFFIGPFVNSKPILSDYSVTPATGKQGTNYIFRVKYTDPNNQRPARARLHLQISDDPAPRGTWITVNMLRESPDSVQFSEGVVYRFETASDPSIVLQPGTRHYYFEFADNWGDPYDPNTFLQGETTLLPANATTNPDDDAGSVIVENTFAGPIVVPNRQPYLVRPDATVGVEVDWSPAPTEVGGDYLASDTFENTATSFTFRTKYVDKNNDAPVFIKVIYRNEFDLIRTIERDLSIAPGSGTLYSDGVVYQVTGIKLPIGRNQFRFTASDGTVVVNTDWQDGPNVVANTPPVLSAPEGGTVVPAAGDPTTLFTFRVLYRDVEGQAPVAANGGFVRVWIDGTEYDMRLAGSPDYTNGALFEYSTRLGAEPAVHQYHFVASDGGNTVRFPTTGEFSGPSVNDPAKLSNPRLIITPAGNAEPRGRSDAVYTFLVTFTNPAGTPPAGENFTGVPPSRVIQVVIDGTPYDLTAREPANPTPADFRNGVTYSVSFTAPNLPVTPGQHVAEFRFVNGSTPEGLRPIAFRVNHRPVLSNQRVLVDGSATTRVHKRQEPTFSVVYRDADGDEPLFVRLFLDGDPTGVDMVSTGGTDYRAGVEYTYRRPAGSPPLTLGNHTYRITAQDANPFAEDATPVEGAFEVFNTRPVLTNHKVTIDGITAVEEISKVARPIFVVTYRDADGDEPLFVRLFIDSDPTGVDMTSTGGADYRAGVEYRHQTPQPLPRGQHTYRIRAQDGLPFPQDADEVSGTFRVVNFRPALSEGSVTPSSGSHNASFTYRVRYADPDGDPAVYVRVHVLRPDGSEERVIQLSGSGENYTQGVVYSGTLPANSQLRPLGTYRFRFEASDGETTAEFAGEGPEVTNVKPRLSGASVVPVRESGRTAFRYTVTYADADGDQPEFVRVVILRGEEAVQTVDMVTEESAPNYVAGVSFAATVVPNTLNLRPGAYTFRIEANDTYEDAEPLTGTGPQVNTPPVLRDPQVTPVVGKLSTEFVFRVTYVDADNDAPVAFSGTPGGEVQVIIDGVAYRMERVGGGTNFAQGVTYELRRRLSEGTHTYTFRARDQFDEAVGVGTETFTGPVVNKATLTLTAPTEPVVVGQPVTLRGQLTLSGGGVVNASILVVISPVVGSGEQRTVETAADGSFSVQFTPATTGRWSAYASWSGNEAYDGVNSAPVSIQVQGVSFVLPVGLSMVSVPLVPPSDDPDFLFGFDTTSIRLLRWSPEQNRYLDSTRRIAEAGAGYWVRVTGEPRTVVPTGTLANQSQPYAIRLRRGWNMIGSVYLQPTQLGAAQVRVGGETMSLREAARRGLVRDFVWRYDQVANAYRLVGASESLEPFVGYWIRALVDADLILNPPGTRSAEVEGITRALQTKGEGWNLQIVARAANSVDTDNYIGVGAESLRIEKPAPFEGYVQVHLLPTDGGAPLAVDVRRSTSAREVYSFEVVTDLPNTPVTLSWPNLARIGRDKELVLVDLDANVRRVMTNLPSYTYQSGANGGSRRFQIIVQPRVRTAAVIAQVRVAQTRSASGTQVQISYTLSTEASVAVQVADASGKVVRVLRAGQATGRGVNTVTWDGRNSAGVALPAGAYVVKITATTDDGQTASVVQPVVLTR